MSRRLLLGILPFFLLSCGFHLRQCPVLPPSMHQIYLISTIQDKELFSKLKTQFNANHVQLLHHPNGAPYWLTLSNFNVQRQIVSVGSGSNPRQYQLTMLIDFLLQTHQGVVIKPKTTIKVSRQLSVNNDRILGSNAEEELLENEMKDDLVIQIMNRLGDARFNG
jgi:LPS-assembly lipoprotein